MKKIGLIALALVLALGTMGAALAWWTETLIIEGNVDTGELDVGFYDGFVESNDNGSTGRIWCNAYYIEPADPGDNGLDPSAAQAIGGARLNNGKDVASTTVLVDTSDYKSFLVEIINAYPSYHPTVFFTIDNQGTIPAKVKEVKITKLGGTDITDYILTACVPVYVDVDTGAMHASQESGDDLLLHLSNEEGRLYKVMNVPPHGYSVCGNLDIHVLQNNDNEDKTMTFEVTIVATQYNAT